MRSPKSVLARRGGHYHPLCKSAARGREILRGEIAPLH